MTSNAVRQRGGKRGATDADTAQTPYLSDDTIKEFKGAAKKTVQREWDYKLALAVITVLAFITRFWGISHPNQVVFDEVHFGKVSAQDERGYNGMDDLTFGIAVCIVLPSANLLLRCPPSLWQTPLCIRRLAGWLRWILPLREHWRLVHHQQGPLRRVPIDACHDGFLDRQRCLLDHVGVWIQPACMHCRGFHRSLRQRAYRTDSSHLARCDSGLLHGFECSLLHPILQTPTCAIWSQVVEVAPVDWYLHVLRY
jgi:hypothetical protein